MSFSKSFLEDEVRLGFYVPASIKQAWAAELEILKAIDKVCSDCNIEYFADWGTFLGAVRHHGFIPWDDDLDLVMRREDYDLFLSKAPSLLPEGYSVHTFRNEEGFREFHAVVINTEHPRFDKKHYDSFHGFPYTCGVDIFVLDYVYDNEENENRRVEDTLFLISLADGILEGLFDERTVKSNLLKAQQICNTSFSNIHDTKELWIKLYEAAEKKCAEVPRNQSDVLTQMVPWGLKKQLNRRYQKSDYDKSVRLPFEDITIPVPLFYDSLLSGRYGNYMNLVKNAGAHDYPYFEKQKNAFEALCDFELPSFSFDESLTASKTFDYSDNWRTIVKECLSEIENYNNIVLTGDGSVSDALCNAQQLSIDLGTLIEEIKGEGHVCVGKIEQYCEAVFNVFSVLESCEFSTQDIAINSLISSFEAMRNSIISDLLNHKEVVFIPFKGANWKSLKPFYEKYSNDSSFDVYVVPIPYYYKEFDGTLSDEQYDLSSYPDDLTLIPYNNFSLEFHHPDIIFIQNPFDEFNASTSVHPEFYSKKIRNYTEKLVYVPWFETYEFDESEDPRSFKNMESYVLTPGVVYSDAVYLFSESAQRNYVEKLNSWSGNSHHEYWTKKITVMDSCQNDNILRKQKSILYFLETGPVCQNADFFIKKITDTITLLNGYDDIVTFLSFSSSLKESLESYYPDIFVKFGNLLQDINRVIDPSKITLSSEFINNFDAYYGDTGALACAFSYYQKTVMIQNYSINTP